MNSLIFNTVSRFLVGLMLLFSIFLLLRGHNEPGAASSAGWSRAGIIVYGIVD
ncbi:MAG: Na(+)/H(+) antiporter subunit B, partial [Rhizobiales bacterium]|nr:Na(+)/H(+) antiporter subunit B [Hyphomicrobiales bacterium]